MPDDPKDPTPAAAAKPASTISKKGYPLVGSAQSGERAGVPDRVPEGRARGGAAARGV